MSHFFGRFRQKRNPDIQECPSPPDFKLYSYPIQQPEHRWIPGPQDGEEFPDGSVCGGRLETGETVYIGRAEIGDQTACGYVLKETRQIHASYGSIEHRLDNYDLLVVDDPSSLLWQRCSDGQIPSNTSCIPITGGGPFREKMLIGRTCTPLTDGHTYEGARLELSRWALPHNEVKRPGKIHRSHGCLYIAYSGLEYLFRDCEMLMMKPSPGRLKDICRWSILKNLLALSCDKFTDIDKLPLPNTMKQFLKTGE